MKSTAVPLAHAARLHGFLEGLAFDWRAWLGVKFVSESRADLSSEPNCK